MTTDLHKAVFDIETDGGHIEATAIYEIEFEQFTGEDGRKTIAVDRCELQSVFIGGLRLTRDMASDIDCEARTKAQEKVTADAFADALAGAEWERMTV